jgi:hypothetical protein
MQEHKSEKRACSRTKLYKYFVNKILISFYILFLKGDESQRYMSAYRIGLTGKQALFAVRKYKSHRRVPVLVTYK